MPVELRFMVSLVDLCVEHNPLSSPPAHVIYFQIICIMAILILYFIPLLQLCTRGRIHIFKYLEIEAIKEDRKRGILEGGDCRRLPRKPSTLPDSRFSANDPRRKRYTIDNSNGFGSCGNSSSTTTPVAVDVPDLRWPQQNNQHTNGHAATTTETAPLFTSNAVNHNQPLKVFCWLVDRTAETRYLKCFFFFFSWKMKTKTNKATRKGEEPPGKFWSIRCTKKNFYFRCYKSLKYLRFFIRASQDEQRLPNHAQTYREYKEALRQQRSNVYKVRDNSHTPSPDTPPMSASQTMEFSRQLLAQPPQQHQRSEGSMGYKPWENSQNHTPDPPIPAHPSPSIHQPPAVIGDFARPLSLNLSHEENNKMNVKAVQKEAVLSYVKAKTSPSSVAQPPPFRSPTTELLSPTLPYRSTPVAPSPSVESNNVTPPLYRPPPAEPPPAGNRKVPAVNTGPRLDGPARLSRQNSLTNSTNGNQTPPPSNHSSHTVATASFTVRREMERQREEMEQIQHLRQVFELFIFYNFFTVTSKSIC